MTIQSMAGLLGRALPRFGERQPGLHGGSVSAGGASRLPGLLLVAALGLAGGGSPAAGLDPFLKTSGLHVRNDHGRGDVVPLRGVNLGSWLLMEPWMCPMDSSGNLRDDWSVHDTLTQRFGAVTKDSLIAAYRNVWLQPADFQNIAALGMNVVRVPFWYLNLQEEDGTWRPDAFARLDWAVSNAWNNGIYTILDLHGAHGGQRADADTTGRRWPSAALWTSAAEQDRMVETWQRVSQHFRGNPAVAGYDLLNEPMDTPGSSNYWALLDRCYQAIRTNDPDHLIIMEATYGSWNFSMLPAPASRGWTNVLYQLHVYPWNDWNNVTNLNAVADSTVQDWVNHAGWNVPCHVGEFNMAPETAWKYAIEKYSGSGMGWQMWAYKSTFNNGTTSWGIYNPNGGVTAVPNVQTDTATVISNRWSQWTTASAFSLNQSHKRTLSMPVARDNSYILNSGSALTVAAPGVLANDSHLNAGGAGIQLQAVKISDPAHGTLSLNTNGSFSYSPSPGFAGTDSFRYKVWDGRIDSTRNATVSIVVSNGSVGPARRLIWTTQPGLATNGFRFLQQPVLRTSDEFGNLSTNDLPASIPVSVILSSGTGALLGTTNLDLGAAASSGFYSFTNLQLNAAGTNKVLTASVVAQTNYSTNLLTNGDFNSPASTAPPAAWTTWTTNGGWANHENKPAVTLNGTYYMVLGGGQNAGGGVHQILPATPGNSYALSVQSGADPWWLPYAEMRLVFRDVNGNQLSSHQSPTVDPAVYGQNYDIPHPWSNYTTTTAAPEGTVQVKVEFAEPNGTGSVWFENASLVASSVQPVSGSASTEPFIVHPAPPPTNYISGIHESRPGVFRLEFVGSTGAEYFVQSTTNLRPPAIWSTVPGSTNTVNGANGVWFYEVTNNRAQSFFRTVTVLP